MLERAIEIDAGNQHSWAQMVGVVSHNGSLRPQLNDVLTRALAACPRSVSLRHFAAEYFFLQGRDKEGEHTLRSLEAVVPRNGVVLRSLGQMEMRRGDRAAAGAYFRRGADPRVPVKERLLCVEEIAELASLEDRPDLARRIFENGAADAGGYGTTARFLRAWGVFERRQKRPDEARALFRQALQRGRSVRTWISWALLERSEGNINEAFRLLRRVRAFVARDWHRFMLCLSHAPCAHAGQVTSVDGSDDHSAPTCKMSLTPVLGRAARCAASVSQCCASQAFNIDTCNCGVPDVHHLIAGYLAGPARARAMVPLLPARHNASDAKRGSRCVS